MAADSIAKLSVLITGDANPLGQTLNRASGNIKQFQSSAVTNLKALSAGTNLLSGNFSSLAGAMRLVGAGPAAAGIVAGTAALAGLVAVARTSVNALDDLRTSQLAVAEEFKKVTGKTLDLGFTKDDTLSHQWDRLGAAAKDFFAIIANNTGLYETLVALTSDLAAAWEQVNSWLKTPEMKATEARVAAAKLEIEATKKKNALLEEQRKTQAKLAEEAQKKAQQEHDALRRRAEDIRESLRTPDEVFGDTVAELKNLANSGVLSIDTLQRGVRDAQDKLNSATKSKKDSLPANVGVGAAERGTAAGFSAVQSGKRELERLCEFERQQLAEAKKAAKQRDELARIVENIRGVTLTPSRL